MARGWEARRLPIKLRKMNHAAARIEIIINDLVHVEVGSASISKHSLDRRQTPIPFILRNNVFRHFESKARDHFMLT
jgi:hypothetical protein